MFSPRRSHRIGLALSALWLLVSAAHAAPQTFLATQVPKMDLTNPAPPALSTDMALQVANFQAAATTTLGRNEFETSQTSTSYTGGTATLMNLGTTTAIVNGDSATYDPSLGRYNMTPGLPIDPSTGFQSWGKWLESTGNFSLGLSTAINAFSFFATDLGDYDGQFSLTFLSHATGQTFQQPLSNSSATNGVKNGNLLFFGIVADFAFDEVDFNITQPSSSADKIGFDSFVYATSSLPSGGTTPEPSSLALVGAALAGLGLSARRMTRR